MVWIVANLFIILLYCLRFKKRSPTTMEETPIVTRKNYLDCAGGKHSMEGVTHQVLIPPKNSIEGVVAITGPAVRQECSVCTFTGAWTLMPVTDQTFVPEVNMTLVEYEGFMSSKETLILEEDQDIIPITKEEEESKND